MYVCMYDTYVCIHTYVYTYIRIYIRIYIYTYIHTTYIHIRDLPHSGPDSETFSVEWLNIVNILGR
jgi:hypothetical protein